MPEARHNRTNQRGERQRGDGGEALKELKARLLEISDLWSAGSVLSWDQCTYMPPGGAAARGRQIATLGRLAHERFTSPAIGKLLDDLCGYAETLPADSDGASLIRVTRRDFEKANKVPASYIARASEHTAISYQAWTRARPANDFAMMRSYLEKTVDLAREYAGFFAPCEHIADPLIDGPDEGMTVAKVKALFSVLNKELVPIVQLITNEPPANDSCLRQHFPEAEQLAFGLAAAKRFGYDLERGRQDKTHHPFCTKFSASDVRITTRVKEDNLGEALFSTLHEAGHALYEQNVSQTLEGTPLGCGASAGVHESQSRLWENIVGRSSSFWLYHYPLLQKTFPEQLGNVALESFCRAINKVERSLIRTDADELTYNLHIMMRFDLELELLEGKLRVKDLPEAWRARMESDLGVVPPDDCDGCLQDAHWYAGSLGGGFQSYTIGNILSAQFYSAACAAHPEIPKEIECGNFAPLRGWLCENVYRHGRKFTPDEIVRRATQHQLRVEPYIAYLRNKYAEFYQRRAAC
jgi:carboxypeptidase Taq